MLKTTLAALALTTVLAPSLALAFSGVHFSRGETISNSIADSIADHHVIEQPQIYNQHVNDALVDVILGRDGVPAEGAQLNAKVKFGAILHCVVSGTPSEFPDDIRIANAGVVTLPAGTSIKWQADGLGGVASLGKALHPGKSLKLSNVLPGGVEAGTVCSAKAIGL